MVKRSSSIKFGKKQISSISWNKHQLDPPMIAAGSCRQKNECHEETMSIFAKENEDWREVYTFSTNEKYSSPSSMLDISWALRHGRLFHYILGCSTNGVFVWKLDFDIHGSESSDVPMTVKSVNLIDFKFIRNTEISPLIRGAWNFMVG